MFIWAIIYFIFLLKIEYDGTRVDEDGEERDSLSESNRLKTDVREKKINLVFSKLSWRSVSNNTYVAIFDIFFRELRLDFVKNLSKAYFIYSFISKCLLRIVSQF